MGMFDSVFFKCPKCRNKIEVQSKAGVCGLYTYPPDEVPLAVAADIGNEIVTCRDRHDEKQAAKGCGAIWQVKPNAKNQTLMMRLEEPDDEEEDN